MARAAFLAMALCLAGGLGMPGASAQVSLDLRDAALRSFVEIVSAATGRRFVVDSDVRGTVTVLAPDTLTPDELYEVFLAVLELNRLTVIEGAGADRIVPLADARELSSGQRAGLPAGFETRVIPVRNLPLSEVVEVVRPLLPAEAVLTPLPGSDLLVLSDRASNHARIEALIQRLDQPRRGAPVEILRLSNASAAEVAQVVQSLDLVNEEGAAITVDRRSNALLVAGSEALRTRVRLLVAELDTRNDTVNTRAVAVNYADAASIADVVLRTLNDETAPEGRAPIRIVPEPQTNTLLISAPQERMTEVVSMIQHLDRRPTQVLVEAVIFEMSVEGLSDLSTQFGAVLNDALMGGVQFALPGRTSLINLVSSVANDGTADTGPAGFIGGASASDGDGIVGLITAIASVNTTRLLSTPSILTLNNQEAEIVVAQNVPFVTGAYSTVGESAVENPFQTIERQDVGLTLTVLPQINADRTVRLAIEQEVSNLTNATSSAGGEITARRKLTTTALVRDGSVIMLGGLLENGSGAVRQEVPGLSKLPVLGRLFQGRNATRNQRVLLVLLRPKVISSDAEAERLTRQIAAKTADASASIRPLDEGGWPRAQTGALPFDGADLNQPFDAGFIDDVAQSRNFPPLPSRLRFD
ncbi:secretin N-terminal domain-containing protein [Citreimonas sp.]|uniref:secretin N-terminal domain-containing protein n=1 Tax=Citreimonas sp. TaxID=3036715 RepID=UPI0035C7E48A